MIEVVSDELIVKEIMLNRITEKLLSPCQSHHGAIYYINRSIRSTNISGVDNNMRMRRAIADAIYSWSANDFPGGNAASTEHLMEFIRLNNVLCVNGDLGIDNIILNIINMAYLT